MLCFIPCLLLAQSEDGLQFVENKGQFDSKVLFRAQLNSGYVYLEKNAITFKLFNPEEYQIAHQHLKHTDDSSHLTPRFDKSLLKKNNESNHAEPIHGHVFTYKFFGALNSSKALGAKPFHEKHNYFLGRDKSKWASNVALFSEVIYSDIYLGIDLRVYSQHGQLKYEWLAKPLADISQIQLEIIGLDDIKIKENNLLLQSSIGSFTDRNLVVTQTVKHPEMSSVLTKNIACDYVLKGNRISYKFPKGYDQKLALVIDPILIFSTYSGSKGDNFGYTATFDVRGNLYAGGITDNTHGEYPVTPGAFQTICRGGQGFSPVNLPCDITISKYDSSGKKLLYATYVGGDEDDYPHSMVVNGDTELVVFGTTYSRNFPMKQNGYDTTYDDSDPSTWYTDIVIFKLSINGDKLQGATFFGGTKNDGLTDDSLRYNYADEFRGEVLTDKNNDIYVVSTTNSDNIDLKNASKSSLEGLADGLCLKFSSNLNQLLWSTYFGGNRSDGIYSLEFDKSENIYIAGGTLSTNLKTHSGAISKKAFGDIDGFMAVFSHKDFTVSKTTYFGTSAYDQIYFLEIDKLGTVYATGQTEGNIKPSAGVYTYTQNSGQFIVIADSNLTNIKKQTVFGSRANNPNLSPSAFLVDSCGNIYISGWGSNVGEGHVGTTVGLPITANALQSNTDGSDFYLAVFGKNLYGLLFATYYGGNRSRDHVDGGTSRFDKRGVIYQSVCSSCPNTPGATLNDFPTTAGSAFPKNVSWRCSNAAFKIDFQISNIVKAKFIPDQVLCGPNDVQFTNQSSGNADFIWDFGDGNTSSLSDPNHTFPNVGQFSIRLVAIDSNTCNVSDTSTKLVTVLQKPTADFELTNVECTGKVEITNKSSDFSTIDWDYGDGHFDQNANPQPYDYPTPGFYKITLVTDKQKLCKDTAVLSVFIRTATFVNAAFIPDTTLCGPAKVQFTNLSGSAGSFVWNFGDGQTSTFQDPKHSFPAAGKYTITLIATDSTTCNVSDTAIRNVIVVKKSNAQFTIKQSECTSRIEIFNNSSDFETSDWDFDDGNQSQVVNPGFYEYKDTGTFYIRMITDAKKLCPDTVTLPIKINGTPADYIVPLNVFTPDDDGFNDCFHFKGNLNECSKYRLVIYNRWGLKVFETKDFNACWNGKVMNIGNECPEGTYLYICDYEGMSPDLKPRFSGTVTLIRH